jgi:hypothetical protein
MAMMMEAVSSSETSVNVYQTTRHNIRKDSHLCGLGGTHTYLIKFGSLTTMHRTWGGQWLALLLRIREVSGSNLGPETGYPDMFFEVFLSTSRHGIVS